MIRRILSLHRARQARLHAPIAPEPDFETEVRARLDQHDRDYFAINARLRLLEKLAATDAAILSREFVGLDKVMTQSARNMTGPED